MSDQEAGLLSNAPQPHPALRRGETAVAIEEAKEKVTSTIGSQNALIWNGVNLALNLLVAAGCFYVGNAIQPLPLCDQPWTLWFNVAGAIAFLRSTTAFFLFTGTRNMLANEHLLKTVVYQEQGRTEEEKQRAGQELVEDKDFLATVASLGANSCCLCFLNTVDLGWSIYAIIMDWQNDHCASMTKYLWYVWGASIFFALLSHCCKPKELTAPPNLGMMPQPAQQP